MSNFSQGISAKLVEVGSNLIANALAPNGANSILYEDIIDLDHLTEVAITHKSIPYWHHFLVVVNKNGKKTLLHLLNDNGDVRIELQAIREVLAFGRNLSEYTIVTLPRIDVDVAAAAFRIHTELSSQRLTNRYYNALHNNCEMFCSYILTGERIRPLGQAERIKAAIKDVLVLAGVNRDVAELGVTYGTWGMVNAFALLNGRIGEIPRAAAEIDANDSAAP